MLPMELQDRAEVPITPSNSQPYAQVPTAEVAVQQTSTVQAAPVEPTVVPPEPQSQPQPQPHSYSRFSGMFQRLSQLSKLFICTYFIIWGGLVYKKHVTGSLFPLLWIPTAIYAIWYHRIRKRTPDQDDPDPDILVKHFSFAFWIASIVVFILELLTTLAIGLVVIQFMPRDDWERIIETIEGDESEELSIEIPKSPAVFAFLFLMSYITAGFVEEGMKFYFGNRIRRVYAVNPDFSSTLIYTVAAALGFSTVENLSYLYLTPTTYSIDMFMLMWLGRILLATPLHCVTAFLMGISFAERDILNIPHNWSQIMTVPVLIHGTFDFHQMAEAVVLYPDETTILIVSIAGNCLILALSCIYARWRYKKFQTSFMALPANGELPV